jgi:hypothetical protein
MISLFTGILRWMTLILALLLMGPFAILLRATDAPAVWRGASLEPMGTAPNPSSARQPIIQIYGARAVGWRGAFGVHTWIALKPRDAEDWTIYQIIGWRVRRGGDALAVSRGQPDHRWFGAEPELYVHLEGDGVERVISRIVAAIETYPYRHTYALWPGPNSNTFIAMIARAIPELRINLPPTAVGKDFLGMTRFVEVAPSGTGYQVSMWGVLGLTLAIEEGVEFNFAGLGIGIDPVGAALRLPGLGRVGAREDPRRQ